MADLPFVLPILYRDLDLVAVDKPSGLSVHHGLSAERVTATDLVRRQVRLDLSPAHRLDRATSGVLLFAGGACRSLMGRAFAEGRVEKSYLALVRGVPPAEGEIDWPIPKDEGGERVRAVTWFRTLGSILVEGMGPGGVGPRRFAWVEARPKTGRFHQVRRHLKHLGHPLVGDTNYGEGRINRYFRENVGLARLALHAQNLAFDHPTTGERVEVSAPLPADLAGLFARMAPAT